MRSSSSRCRGSHSYGRKCYGRCSGSDNVDSSNNYGDRYLAWLLVGFLLVGVAVMVLTLVPDMCQIQG